MSLCHYVVTMSLCHYVTVSLCHYVTGDAGDFTHPALAAARARGASSATADPREMGPVTLRPEGGGILVVSNPPWGKRIGGGEDDRGRGGRPGGDGDARYDDEGAYGGGDVNFDTRGRDGFQADADWGDEVSGGEGDASMDRNTAGTSPLLS